MDDATLMSGADAGEDEARQTERVALPQQQPEGIHFGLDEAIYHADPALGSGSIRDLARAPVYYWVDSWMNPFRDTPAETPALLYGRALHCLVLEGPSEFARRYAAIPEASDYPDALVTAEDIKDRLREFSKDELKAADAKLSAAKPELVAALKRLDPDAVVFDDLIAAFRERCADEGITALSAKVHSEIIQAAAYILGDARVQQAFRGGRPEVSLFWDQGGVPMKARLDYLRLGKEDGRLIGIVTDLKSFANALDLPPERAVTRAIATTRLDVQAAAYLEGIKRIPEWIAAGKVHGADGVNPDWLKALGSIKPEDWRFSWVFYEKGLPVSMLRTTRPGSPVIQMAKLSLDRALQAYRDNMEAFGMQWRFVDPLPDPEVSIDDLPRWLGE